MPDRASSHPCIPPILSSPGSRLAHPVMLSSGRAQNKKLHAHACTIAARAVRRFVASQASPLPRHPTIRVRGCDSRDQGPLAPLPTPKDRRCPSLEPELLQSWLAMPAMPAMPQIPEQSSAQRGQSLVENDWPDTKVLAPRRSEPKLPRLSLETHCLLCVSFVRPFSP